MNFELTWRQWWPTAEFRELRIVAFLAIWLFLWDDALDEPTGEYADNFEAAQVYRSETEQFLADCLGLSTSKEISTVVTYPAIDGLKGFGMYVKKMLLEYFLGVSPEPKRTVKPSNGFFGSVKVLGNQVKSAFRWTLGMKTAKIFFPPRSSHPIIESFRVIGDELKLSYTVGKTLCNLNTFSGYWKLIGA